MTGSTDVFFTVIGFIIFWSIVAYIDSKKNNKAFFDTMLRYTGLHLWYKKPGAQIGLSLILSIVMTFVSFQMFTNSTGSGLFFGLLVVLFFALPIINAIIYGFGNEKGKKIAIMMNTAWFTIMLLTIIVVIIFASNQ